MERKEFGYSLKNIPLPSKQSYIKSMIGKMQSFIKRMRWRALFFDNPSETENVTNRNYGFRSEKTPPQNKELLQFENDLYSMIKNLQWRESKLSQFQVELSKDLKEMKSSNQLYVPADKTTNVYKISAEQYSQLLKSNITSNYKKADKDTQMSIDREAKGIAVELGLQSKVECYAERDAFITLKDHKDNFANNPKCRLINPAKSEIGLISKQHLEEIISDVKQKLSVNQWRQTSAVIQWFKAIKNKPD